MKRICFVTTLPITLRTFVSPQASLLVSSGWHVTWVSGGETPSLEGLPHGVTYVRMPLKRGIDLLGLPKAILLLWRLFKEERFDLVQYSTPNAAFYASTAAWLARVPVRLYAQWGIRYVGFSGWRRWLFKRLEAWTCARSTVVEPDSRGNLEFSIAEGLYPRNKGRVIGRGSACGVDLTRFDIDQKEVWRREYRRRIGLSSDHVVVGFVGSVRRDKGCNELIRAFRSVSERLADARLLLIGDHQFAGTLEDDVRAWIGESERVVSVLASDEIPQYMACMDVLALPSYREGFGMVVIEAQAMGVPVIVSDVPGPTDALLADRTGLVVPVRDERALEQALVRLLGDAELRARMGASGHELVRVEFEQTELLRKMLEDKESLVSCRLTASTQTGVAR